ncbi:Dedicator of cytokinesis family protein [Trichomonas vaginalis G3]|uniref:Dedicator of cytokinesis family protein n=1 Tax=Trichomonas vaginalis (strain ATCC PRA-98 / G3) TaxID=412133 RepID=A2EAY2_TRIV3|nr:dedicator of cytokinesis DOCK family [Trichomonas vaginalis G3]EAY10227.1 Dedicator of cytokinesis family protein [Trichomonas vaginalis G3]KAI5514015.1 dedicator of cytokinesis DOCK family [Trichomonas vaginalis G3]|eukprot:XP_001322450.1 Dedicator of cytokinesis family protein [Trichomonas vaginalis G3]
MTFILKTIGEMLNIGGNQQKQPKEENTKAINLAKLEESENSLSTPYSTRLVELSGFANNPILRLFTDKNQNMEILKPAEQTFFEDHLQEIFFKHEFDKLPQGFVSDEKVMEFPTHILAETAYNSKPCLFQDFPNEFNQKKHSIVLLKNTKLPKNDHFIEPLICTAYLVIDDKIDSEPWHFIPNETFNMYKARSENIITNEKAGFILNGTPQNSGILVIISRILQVNNGDAVNDYYFKPNEKNLALAKESVANVFGRLKDIYSPFAYTYANIGSIAEQKDGIDLPQPFLLKKMFADSDVPELIKRMKEKGNPQIPINIHMHATFAQNEQPQRIVSNDYNFIHPVDYDDTVPCTIFRHELNVKIQTIMLKLPPKVKGRNIICVLSMTNGKLEPGTIQNPKVTDKAERNLFTSTICYYHETKPVLNETITISLPPILDPDASLRIDLYHAIAQTSYERWSEIGWCELPLANKDGQYIAEGVQDLPVIYNGQSDKVPIDQNHVTVEVSTRSLIMPPDTTLNQFINNKGSVSLANVDRKLVKRYLLIILDVIFTNFNDNPDFFLDQLFLITEMISPIFPAMDSFMNRYAMEFSKTVDLDILLTSYGKHFEKSGGEKVNTKINVINCDMLFLIATKSCIQNKDKKDISDVLIELSKSIANFAAKTVKNGLNAASDLLNSLARFLVALCSIGMVSKVCEAIDAVFEELTKNMWKGDTDCHSILARFLDSVWCPKFYKSDNETPHIFLKMLIQKMTIKTVEKCVKFATENSDSLPMQDIYFTFLTMISSFNRQECRKMAKLLKSCLTYLNPLSKLPFANTSESYYAILFSVFLLDNMESDVFSEWFKTFENKPALFESLHFLIENSSSKRKFTDLGSGTVDRMNNLEKLERQYNNSSANSATKEKTEGQRSFKKLKKLPPAYSNDDIKLLSETPDPNGSILHQNEMEISASPLMQSDLSGESIAKSDNATKVELPPKAESLPNTAPAEEKTRSGSVYIRNDKGSSFYIKGKMNPPKDVISAEIEKRIIAACHKSVINTLNLLIEVIDDEHLSDMSLCVYHLLCTDVVVQAIPSMIEVVMKLINKKTKIMFEQSVPPLAKFVARIIELSVYFPNAYKIVEEIFESDLENYKSNDRSNCIVCRALPLIQKVTDSDIDKLTSTKPSGKKFKALLKEYFTGGFEQNNEEKGDILYTRALIVRYSPDAQYLALKELAEHHHKYDYFAEEIQVKSMMLCVLAENLSLKSKIKNVFGSSNFKSICQNYNDIKCNYKEDLKINGFCDSPFFCISSIVNLATEIITVANDKTYYEVAIAVSEYVVPILESDIFFGAASNLIKLAQTASQKLAACKPGELRLFGRYYRVRFFGAKLGKQDGQTYIYREKLLTNVYNLANRLNDEYSKKYGAVETIMESSKVVQSKLDKNKIYIQPTSVEALIDESEMRYRKTDFEKNDNLMKFYLDIPFTKDGKSQGNVATQCLRRVIFTPKTAMPCATKRVLVERVEEIEYSPIQVTCNSLSARVAMLKNAIQAADYQTVQQLLHGNLMVQVNEGPSKMAEVFLNDGQKGQYYDKLREIFRDFLKTNQEGLKLHAKYILSKPIFTMMQHELEAGYETLEFKLKPYLGA